MKTTPNTLRKTVAALKKEEAEILHNLDRVRDMIERLDQITALTGRRRAPASKGSRRLSAKGREAISRAAKKRWAAYRKEQRQTL